MQATPGSDRATWACDVRWVVFECSTVLRVAVKTAVTWWQADALRDDRGGCPLDAMKRASPVFLSRPATRPGSHGADGARLWSVLSSPLSSARAEGLALLLRRAAAELGSTAGYQAARRRITPLSAVAHRSQLLAHRYHSLPNRYHSLHDVSNRTLPVQ
jgi:hypothetical protein